MNEWQLFGSTAAALTLILVFLGLLWKIIQDVKNSVHSRIDRLEENLKTFEHSVNELVEQGTKKREELRKDLLNYSDFTFERKDVHSVEYTALVNMFKALEHKIDKIINGK